jgi:hypothetical protein
MPTAEENAELRRQDVARALEEITGGDDEVARYNAAREAVLADLSRQRDEVREIDARMEKDAQRRREVRLESFLAVRRGRDLGIPVTHMAAELGTSRSALYDWIANTPVWARDAS